jgi:hypothetical protein
MAYRYNENRHHIKICVDDRYPETPWEIALYSSYSGRKLKVYDRVKSYDVAKHLSAVIRNPQP